MYSLNAKRAPLSHSGRTDREVISHELPAGMSSPVADGETLATLPTAVSVIIKSVTNLTVITVVRALCCARLRPVIRVLSALVDLQTNCLIASSVFEEENSQQEIAEGVGSPFELM